MVGLLLFLFSAGWGLCFMRDSDFCSADGMTADVDADWSDLDCGCSVMESETWFNSFLLVNSSPFRD